MPRALLIVLAALAACQPELASAIGERRLVQIPMQTPKYRVDPAWPKDRGID